MQQNANTNKYWDSVWSVIRKVDNPNWLIKCVKNSIKEEYWQKVFAKPGDITEKYAMFRAWWYIHKLQPKSILEVGCGNGRLLYGAKYLVPGCNIFGIDLSERAIEMLHNYYEVKGAVMNIKDLDKAEKKFDMVISVDVAEHLRDDVGFIKRCKARLNPGGWLYTAFPNNHLPPEKEPTHFRTYTPETAKKLIKRHFNNYQEEILTIHIMTLAQNV